MLINLPDPPAGYRYYGVCFAQIGDYVYENGMWKKVDSARTYLHITAKPMTDMDYVLVGQKDRILYLISEKNYNEAVQALEVVRELWSMHDYEYKYDELLAKIR